MKQRALAWLTDSHIQKYRTDDVLHHRGNRRKEIAVSHERTALDCVNLSKAYTSHLVDSALSEADHVVCVVRKRPINRSRCDESQSHHEMDAAS